MLGNLYKEDFFGTSHIYIADIVFHQLVGRCIKEYRKTKIYIHAKDAIEPWVLFDIFVHQSCQDVGSLLRGSSFWIHLTFSCQIETVSVVLSS